MSNDTLIKYLEVYHGQLNSMLATQLNGSKGQRTRAIALQCLKLVGNYRPMGDPVLEKAKATSTDLLNTAILHANRFSKKHILVPVDHFTQPAILAIEWLVQAHNNK